MASNAAWRLVRGGDIRVKMPVGSAITKSFVPVTLSSGKVAIAANGETVWGVAITEATTDELVPVIVDPNAVFEAQAGTDNLAPGDPCYLGASYAVDAGTSANLACGVVVDYDPASAGLVHFLLLPAATTKTTHS
jgi:hypothetical protein